MKEKTFFGVMSDCEYNARKILCNTNSKIYWEGYITAIQNMKEEYKIFMRKKKEEDK